MRPAPGPLGARPAGAGGTDLRLPGEGVTLAATSWEGRGPTVVLLHGLASQRWFWTPVVRRLPGLAVLALDARGHGDSDAPDFGYDVPTVVADVRRALAAHGVRRAVVVGHSWGATVATALAAGEPSSPTGSSSVTAPPAVAACVAIDGGFAALGRDEPRAALRSRLEPPRWALSTEHTLAALAARRPAWWTDEAQEAVLPIFAVGADGLVRARLTYERHMLVLDGLLDHDAAATLAALRCPTWLVSCEPSAAVAADAPSARWAAEKAAGLERAAGLVGDLRALRWAGADHDVPLQWPALVAGLVAAAAEEASRGEVGSDPRGGSRGGGEG